MQRRKQYLKLDLNIFDAMLYLNNIVTLRLKDLFLKTKFRQRVLSGYIYVILFFMILFQKYRVVKHLYVLSSNLLKLK